MGFLGTIFNTVVGGLLGRRSSGGGSAAVPPGADGSLQASQVPEEPQQDPEQGKWYADVLDSFINEGSSAMASKMFAGMRGSATRKYNEAAFPDSNTWEHLGGGAHGQQVTDLAKMDRQLRQSDRENQRNNDTHLAQARINAGLVIANTMVQDGGRANLGAAAEILRKTGGLPPDMDIDPKVFARGRTEAAIGQLDAQSYQSYATGKQNLSQAQLNAIEAELAPAKYALDVWTKRYGGSRIANNARAITDLFNDGVLAATKGSRAAPHPSDVAEAISDALAATVGEREAVQFMEIYENQQGGKSTPLKLELDDPGNKGN